VCGWEHEVQQVTHTVAGGGFDGFQLTAERATMIRQTVDTAALRGFSNNEQCVLLLV
jgi:hypothetical protein